MSELCLEMLWSPSYEPSKFEDLASRSRSFKSFQASIIASIARSHCSDSDCCGPTYGEALEPEF